MLCQTMLKLPLTNIVFVLDKHLHSSLGWDPLSKVSLLVKFIIGP
jgi:hypothetical protein